MDTYFLDEDCSILEEAADDVEEAQAALIMDTADEVTDIDRVADISEEDVDSIPDEDLYDDEIDAGILATDDDYTEDTDSDDIIYAIDDDEDDIEEDDDEDFDDDEEDEDDD